MPWQEPLSTGLTFFWRTSRPETWVGNSMEIMKLLEEINNRGTTVLVVTHNREIVNSMKKRVITMRKGVVVSDEKEGEYHEV